MFLKGKKYLILSLVSLITFLTLIPSCSLLKPIKGIALWQRDSSATVSLQTVLANLPQQSEILSMPIAEHPRLILSSDRLGEIKQQIVTDEVMKKWYQELKWKANYYARDPELPRYTTVGAGQLLPVSQRLVERVSTLGLVYLLSDEPQYLAKTWQELEAVAQFPDWNPAHFLDTAEMTYALAIAYDWLYDSWNESQKSLLRKTIVAKGLEPALQGYKQQDRWTEVENNWNLVCNGGIGIGAIAILPDFPQVASQALASALQKIPLAMQHYAPDGGWSEGLIYWHYGTLYNTLLLTALDTSFSSDFSLSRLPGFSETGFFPIYLTNQFGLPFNFADSKYRNLDAPEMFWLSQRYKQPTFARYARRHAVPEAMDLIWYQPEMEGESLTTLPLDSYFQSVEVASLRSDWQNPDGIFLAFKAGDNQANHGNLDLGTFVLDALGVRWGVDLGSDDYGLPGYFDKWDQRWDYYRMRAEGQNTLIINPDREPDQDINAKAQIVRTKFQPERGYAIADLTPAYAAKTSQVKRGIALQDQRHQALIQDEISASSPVNVFWFMHTNAEIKIAPDRRSAILVQDGKQLLAQIRGTDKGFFSQMSAKPLPTSPNPVGQAENTQLKKLTIELKAVTDSQFAVLFTPVTSAPSTTDLVQIKRFKKW
ncbi:MAG: heparinase II/III family protein [Cyanobacteria bacterium J06600_6]